MAVERLLSALAGIAASTLAGCVAPLAKPPSDFTDRQVHGDPFEHRVFTRRHPSSGTLHVYIEGDGRAWLDRTTISTDPTPRRALMLELMALDAGPSAYVGRPCYFGLAQSHDCAATQWTSERYSAEVVDSMQSVIEQLLAEGRYEHVTLFGHSGGGTLATLLAERMPEVDALVTIAPNLNVTGWAELHGYTPLRGSIDPLHTAKFPRGILQVHWVGADDDEITPRLLDPVRPLLGVDAEIRVRADFDHHCCWQEIWPAQLAEIDARLAQADGSRPVLNSSSSTRTTPRPEESLQ